MRPLFALALAAACVVDLLLALHAIPAMRATSQSDHFIGAGGADPRL